jgi:hypothetical protein
MSGNIAMVNVLLPYINLHSFNEFQDRHPLRLGRSKRIEVVLALLPKFNIAAWNIATPHDFMNTPLAYLNKLNHPEITKMLTSIFSRFDTETLNSLNQDGETMLHSCALNNNVALASVLIALKADLNIKNNQGHTALMQATQLYRFDIMSMLIKAGADITAVGRNNCTALTCADNRYTQFLLLSALPLKSILLEKQSLLRDVAIKCIKAVNEIRDTIFHTLFALQTRKKTSLPNDPATLVLSYLERPEWYDHRFNADIQAMLKRVGMVLRRREEAAKQSRVTNSTATQLPSNALTLLAAPAQTFLPAAVSSSDSTRGMKRARSTQSTPVTIAPVENNATSAATGHRYPKRATRSFTRPCPK